MPLPFYIHPPSLIRKFLKRLVPLLLMTIVITACAPVQGYFVRLDPNLQEWIVYGATLLVGIGLMALSSIPALKWLADYLGPYRAAISAWLAGVIIQLAQAGILDRIPQIWDNVVTIVMQLIVAVIVTLYSFRLLRDRNVKGFQA